MNEVEIIKLAVQGGIGILMFIAWIVTFKAMSENNKRTLEEMTKITAEAFSKHQSFSETLVVILKDEQEYKTTLTGVLDRISYRLETPAQCPILIPGRKMKLEVTE